MVFSNDLTIFLGERFIEHVVIRKVIQPRSGCPDLLEDVSGYLNGTLYRSVGLQRNQRVSAVAAYTSFIYFYISSTNQSIRVREMILRNFRILCFFFKKVPLGATKLLSHQH